MMKSKNTVLKIFATILFIFSAFSIGYAQQRSQSFSDLFQSNSLLNIRFESDFKKVLSNTDDSTNFPALLSYNDEYGKKVDIKLEIRTRGDQRRIECSFMPIRLEFNEEDVVNTLFEDQKSLKLVTHCRKPSKYEQNAIIEYLVYRALNVLTDTSFRVRPMLINYVYNDRKRDSIQKFGFIIERYKYMAERLDMTTFKNSNFHSENTDIDHMNLVDMFQFMIGNTDYSVFKLHNTKLIMDTTQNQSPCTIPYDFDWGGLIAASYARPNPMFGTKEVENRIYRGNELDPLRLQKVIHRFNLKRSEIFELFESEELLDRKEKKRVKAYLEEFYRIINKEGIINEFIEVARSLGI